MPIQEFSARDFRCLTHIELDADPGFNLIYGANASGKTSILEALAYLGRGKSFRGAPTTSLIRHGEKEFVLFGRVVGDGRPSNVGVRNSSEGLEVRIDGESDGGSTLHSVETVGCKGGGSCPLSVERTALDKHLCHR